MFKPFFVAILLICTVTSTIVSVTSKATQNSQVFIPQAYVEVVDKKDNKTIFSQIIVFGEENNFVESVTDANKIADDYCNTPTVYDDLQSYGINLGSKINKLELICVSYPKIITRPAPVCVEESILNSKNECELVPNSTIDNPTACSDDGSEAIFNLLQIVYSYCGESKTRDTSSCGVSTVLDTETGKCEAISPENTDL